MKIECIQVGPLQTNCYILCDEDRSAAAVIDPGFEAERILSALDKTGCKIEKVILTHGHFDHIEAAGEILDKTGVKLYAFDKELTLLQDPDMNLHTRFMHTPFRVLRPDVLISDGGEIEVGGLKLRFMHTPGHTSGSCCIFCGNVIFSGDTIFHETIGGTDHPTGDIKTLFKTVKKIAAIEADYDIFPGHGEPTTLSHERVYNPYMGNNDDEIVY